MNILAPVMTLCLSSHIHVHVCNDETALVLLTHKDIGTLYSNTIMYHISFIFGRMLIQFFLFVDCRLCCYYLSLTIALAIIMLMLSVMLIILMYFAINGPGDI